MRKIVNKAVHFWSKVDKTDTCWLWLGRCETERGGYGQFDITRKQIVKCHRYSYELAYGPIPDGQQVLHRCDTPRCVRPDHLFLGDNTINVQDRVAKRRSAAGSSSGAAVHPDKMWRSGQRKLSCQKAAEIRQIRSEGAAVSDLAKMFDVGYCTIVDVLANKTWRTA